MCLTTLLLHFINLQTVIVSHQVPITVPGDIQINKYSVADLKALIILWRKRQGNLTVTMQIFNVLTECGMRTVSGKFLLRKQT